MARIDRAVPSVAKWLRRHAVTLFALLLSLVVVSGALRSGSSFVYCEMMHSFQHEPCCAHDRAGASPEDAAVDASHLDCCTTGTFPFIPSAELVKAPEASEARLAVVPFDRYLSVAPRDLGLAGETRGTRSDRTHSVAPPGPTAYRARRMVFLT